MKRLWQWLIFLLVNLVTFVGIIGWQAYSQAQSPSADKLTLETAGLTLQELSSGVYGLISSTDFPSKNSNAAICNAGIVIGTDGVLLIDPFHSAALGNLLFSTAQKLTNQPVRYVLNTHYHFDHTGGNAAAAGKAVSIVGRGLIRDFMVNRNQKLDPNPTPPNLVVNGKSTIWLGKRQIELTAVEGHSGGTDVVAYVPDAKVLFTGDILFNQRFPYTGDGSIRQWQSTLTQLISTYPNIRILPGHGPVTDQSGLKTLKAYFDQLEKQALSWKSQSLTEKQVLATAAKIPAAYKDYKFQALYTDNLQTAYREFTQGDTTRQ